MLRSAAGPVQQGAVSPLLQAQPATLKGLLSRLQLSGGLLVLFVGTTELLPAIIAGGNFVPASITVGVEGLLVLAPPPAAELLELVTLLFAGVPAADGCAAHAIKPAAPSSRPND